MNRRWAVAALAVVVALLGVGCGRAVSREATTPPATEHRFVHVHDFLPRGCASPRRPGCPG